MHAATVLRVALREALLEGWPTEELRARIYAREGVLQGGDTIRRIQAEVAAELAEEEQ